MVSSKPVNGGLSAPERGNGAYHVHALAARGLLSLKELKVDLCWSHAEGDGDAPFFFIHSAWPSEESLSLHWVPACPKGKYFS